VEEGNLAGVRFAEGHEHFHTTQSGRSRNLADQTAFPDTGLTDHADHRAVALDCTVQQAFNGGHLPPPTHQIRLSTPDAAMPVADAQQAACQDWFIGTLDLNQFRLT
jgi:hypothetical protein